jgi:hypothetical protein
MENVRGSRVGERDAAARLTGWVPPPNVDERGWVECGKRLGTAGIAMSWWIGDWLRYGQRAFGERYALAARITGYDVQTLMNYAYVAAHVPAEERRPGISWSHHAELAKLDQASRSAWLDRVTHLRLSVRDLRLMLRKADRQGERRLATAESLAAVAPKCPRCGQPLPAKPTVDAGVSYCR